MRLVMVFLLFWSGLSSQSPFEMIEQFVKQDDNESYAKHLENSGYYAVPEVNTDTEQHFRKGVTNVFLTSSTCNHIVISSTDPTFSERIESRLHEKRNRLLTSSEYGRKKFLWHDDSNNSYVVLVNPDSSYELYFANCAKTNPTIKSQP